MLAPMRRSRFALFATFALVTPLVIACEDPVEPEEDPADAIVTLRLVVGGKTIDVRKADGRVTNGPIVIGAGASTLVVSSLDANGAVVSGLDDFEVRATSGNTAMVTFASTGKFTATLTRVAAGSTTLSLGLWHLEEAHFDIGPFPVPITVQ